MTTRTRRVERHAYEPDYLTEPGTILQETIDSLGMSQKELAKRTGYSTKHVNQLISGKARMTHDAAIRLEKVTRVPASFWNNLESNYQDHKARIEETERVEQDIDWLSEIPFNELVKRGVIERQSNSVAKVEASLRFFGVASVAVWRKGWTERQIAFRKAAGAEKCIGKIAAWVRLAEIEADEVECDPFDERKFRKALKAIRGMTTDEPREFVDRMRALCSESGVACVLVPEIPGGRVNGAARWLSDKKALIAINLRGKSSDKFWFTFFHEAGHILNDRRDQVFVDVEYADDPRETAANQYASEMLIPAKYESTLPTLKSKAAVLNFAEKLGIDPGIVVGRLQHDKVVGFDRLNDLKTKIMWSEEES